ncbi:MAG: hypothetical protein NTW96_05605 [Planctomycetia bacterium]|nr:hypothetical protein [Planctomycetia bacterium]
MQTSRGQESGEKATVPQGRQPTVMAGSSAAQLLVVGDASGNIVVKNIASGNTVAGINLHNAAIGNITVPNIDGTLQVLATYSSGTAKLPTYSLNLNTLSRNWQTDHPTAMSSPDPWHRVYSGDFNSDGKAELVIPYSASGNLNLNQVFSGGDGKRILVNQSSDEYSVYQDPRDSSWRMIAISSPNGFTHYMRNYDLKDGSLKWENTSVNTWKVGSVGASMIDRTPRVWGGWYGRTAYVLDGDGNLKWSKRFGGSYEADAHYAGDLRGDGTEALIIGGTTGHSPNLVNAVKMSDGSALWTHSDPTTNWSENILNVVDVNGDGVKEVFVYAYGPTNQYLALNGSTGSLLWKTSYPTVIPLSMENKFTDVNEDGTLDILLAVGNTVEARDGMTGALLQTHMFPGAVTSFDLAPVFAPVSKAEPNPEEPHPASPLKIPIGRGS